MEARTNQELLAFMKLSPTEKFLAMMNDIKMERETHPEKYPYQKPGLYIGGIRWEAGDEIINGEDGLQHIINAAAQND